MEQLFLYNQSECNRFSDEDFSGKALYSESLFIGRGCIVFMVKTQLLPIVLVKYAGSNNLKII